MNSSETFEKNRNRLERRTAFVTHDTNRLFVKEEWVDSACIGAINTQFTTKNGTTTNEWHYFISSRKLTADELLKHALLEWSAETMHWFLD